MITMNDERDLINVHKRYLKSQRHRTFLNFNLTLLALLSSLDCNIQYYSIGNWPLKCAPQKTNEFYTLL